MAYSMGWERKNKFNETLNLKDRMNSAQSSLKFHALRLTLYQQMKKGLDVALGMTITLKDEETVKGRIMKGWMNE